MTKFFVTSPVADIHGAPDRDALRGKFESQLVLGEEFIVSDIRDGWAAGKCAHDGYKGHVEARHISEVFKPPTHRVTAIRSFVYRDPTMKSPRQYTLSFGSRIALGKEENGYVQLADGNWIYAKHVMPLADKIADPVPLAQAFLEVPYFWGGRSGFGIDCSGMMQVVMAQMGITLPRDTEEQIKIGEEKTRTHRGDLVFFPGHVGIMADDENIIHANAFHMKVTLEPLWQVEERAKGITMIRGF